MRSARRCGWPVGLAREPLRSEGVLRHHRHRDAGRRRSSTSSRIDPIKALFWAAVINGVVAVPLMVVIMLMAMQARVMGNFILPWPALGDGMAYAPG